jgi:outer membrane protein TolC
MSMVELEVRQDLPWPGSRRGRREVASAEAAAVEVEGVGADRALEREVSETYARLYALDQRLARLDDAHELMEVLVAAVDLRFGAGESGAAEALAMRLELSEHDAEREAVAAERAAAAARLREALALPAGTPIGRVGALPAATAPPADFVRLVPRVAPAALAAEARALAATRRAELARLELRPELSVAAGLGWRDGLDPMVYAGAGVELPLFRAGRERPRVDAAVDEASAMASDAHALRLALRAEAEALAAAWRRLERRRALYDEALMPQSSAAFDAARAAFLAGDRELASLLEALERWLEIRIERAEIEAERFAVGAAVAALIGPTPTGELP